MRILPKVCFCVISILHPNICFFLFENRLFQSLFKCISRTVPRNHLTFKISLEIAFSYSKVAGKTMYKGLCVSGNQEVYWDSGGSQHFQSSWDKILPLLFEVNKIGYFPSRKLLVNFFCWVLKMHPFTNFLGSRTREMPNLLADNSLIGHEHTEEKAYLPTSPEADKWTIFIFLEK